MFSDEKRCIYRRNQLSQVVCQLRFPEILAIGSRQPVEFQEAIRGIYPQYQCAKAKVADRLKSNEETEVFTLHHHFFSADGVWKLNLTNQFISVSTSKYTAWEEFAAHLDQPLAAFISIYRPAYFERIGLRYINFISRKSLKLEDALFNDLIRERYLGVMADEELKPSDILRSSMDLEFKIRGGCCAKIHAGPGVVKTIRGTDPEVKFIFDQDLYMPGRNEVRQIAPALHTLHAQAFSIFRDAITDRLHEALEPEES